MDYEKLIQENILESFKHYVSKWKKQNADTVKVNGDVYEYTTKRNGMKPINPMELILELISLLLNLHKPFLPGLYNTADNTYNECMSLYWCPLHNKYSMKGEC